MADNPQKSGRERPLSPHLTIWRWQVTMLASIMHRATGMALAGGAIVLAWWLVSISNGPEGYDSFMVYAAMPLGIVVLFGFTWSFAFHFLNGVRHLAWDLGYGFDKHVATKTGFLVFALSFLIAIAAFAVIWTGHAGYLQ
jgi:succinate dehydrogenase / fumarate reductase, cytochrome b subunit